MRILTQHELVRATRSELNALLHSIAQQAAQCPEGSPAWLNAQTNLRNIRRALSGVNFGPPAGPRL